MVVATFFKTALSDIEKTKFVSFTKFLIAFCDVCSNRNSSTSKLRDQTCSFISRKMACHFIDKKSEGMGFLPRNNIFKTICHNTIFSITIYKTFVF